MSMINKGVNAKTATPLQNVEARYNTGIANLLLVIAFTVINIVLLVVNSNTYFLFSAFVPYIAVDYGMYFCGMYPAEYYYGNEEFYPKSFLYITIAFAAVVLLIYFLCWLFAKKKKVGWLIFALVFFCIDTAVMLIFTGISMDIIMDVIFHIWVIFSLSIGIYNYFKMQKLSKELPITAEEECDVNDHEQTYANSTVLRMVDPDVKARNFVEAEFNGHRIVYRRVKKTNELVIDDKVYDEYVALMEFPHTLSACIDGNKIEAEYDGVKYTHIYVNGQEIAKKVRLI